MKFLESHFCNRKLWQKSVCSTIKNNSLSPIISYF